MDTDPFAIDSIVLEWRGRASEEFLKFATDIAYHTICSERRLKRFMNGVSETRPNNALCKEAVVSTTSLTMISETLRARRDRVHLHDSSARRHERQGPCQLGHLEDDCSFQN
jgi:hypothetical protein